MRFRYLEWDDKYNRSKGKPPFETLLDLFQELMTLSGGDVRQALKWMTDLDQEHHITDQFGEGDDGYDLGRFIEELIERGYLEDGEQAVPRPTGKLSRSIRQKSLEQIFSRLNKGAVGNHKTVHTGRGLERQPETRRWKPGDDLSRIDSTGTMMNMLRHSSLDSFNLEEDDLQVHESDHYTSAATVLLIDLSHSMVLYGEDRITPAKKVAMALAELIMSRYEKDSLDIVAFGNEAWKVQVKDLPYLEVGPFHTNTLHALEVARHTLLKKRHANRKIFMITDGKPSCMFEDGRLYKNSFGLDRKIINKVLDAAVMCRRDQIDITTFMIARDPYLQDFVRELTEANKGRAYFSSLDSLGGYIFQDYVRNRVQRLR